MGKKENDFVGQFGEHVCAGKIREDGEIEIDPNMSSNPEACQQFANNSKDEIRKMVRLKKE